MLSFTSHINCIVARWSISLHVSLAGLYGIAFLNDIDDVKSTQKSIITS